MPFEFVKEEYDKDDLRRGLEDMAAKPIWQPGARWKHYKGNIYEVVGLSLAEPNGVFLVTYRVVGKSKNSFWTRTLTDWTAQIMIGNCPMPRFAPMK